MSSRLGVIRATWLVSTACLGSFLFAYDTGIIGMTPLPLTQSSSLFWLISAGGILTLDSFKSDFGYSGASKDVVSTINGNCGSILQGGAFFGCLWVFSPISPRRLSANNRSLIWPVTKNIGRRWSLILASLIFEIGTVLQILNLGHLWVFYVGRAVSGVAVGACTVLIPIFAGEMSPKEIRGRLGSFFQLFFATGVAVSYWVDYAVTTNVPPSTRQWQIPISIQFIPGAMLGLGMLVMPESVRWLVQQDRIEEARAALVWVRGDATGESCQAEFAEIVTGVNEDARAKQGLSWRELLLPVNRYRIFVAVSLQICQQLTGNTSLAYFAPQVFGAIAGGSNTTDVYLTGFFGVVKVVAVIFFIAFFIDRIGRKTSFITGAAAMGTCMLAIAIIVFKHPPSALSEDSSPISAYGKAAVALTYLEVICFNLSWGPMAWLYLGEIFSNRIREVGVAAGAGAQWLANFGMSQATPHALNALGWGTFLMFACFNFTIVLYSYFVLKETSGHSLEEMEEVFNRDTGPGNKALTDEERRHTRSELLRAARCAAQGIVAARQQAGIPPHQSRQWSNAVLEQVGLLEADVARDGSYGHISNAVRESDSAPAERRVDDTPQEQAHDIAKRAKASADSESTAVDWTAVKIAISPSVSDRIAAVAPSTTASHLQRGDGERLSVPSDFGTVATDQTEYDGSIDARTE